MRDFSSRILSHVVASMMSGFVLLMVTSMAPVEVLSGTMTRVQLAPPSSVMNRPRDGSVSCSAPITATKTRLSSRGSMTIWPIVSPSFRPMFVHVAPPSVDL
jgi:hypothetical protein